MWLSRERNLHLLSGQDLCLSFRYALRSPYRRSPVGGEPFHRRAVCTPASTPERPGNSSSKCSRCDCWCFSSPNRRRASSLPRNPARRLSSRVRPPIHTRDRIPLPEAKSLFLRRNFIEFSGGRREKKFVNTWKIDILLENSSDSSWGARRELTLGTFESFMSHSWWGWCCCWLPATVADIVGDPTRLLQGEEL